MTMIHNLPHPVSRDMWQVAYFYNMPRIGRWQEPWHKKKHN